MSYKYPENRREQSRRWRKNHPEYKIKQRLYSRKWMEKNREKWKTYQKQYEKNCPDKVKAKYKRWREKNKGKVRILSKEWRKRNKIHIKQYRFEKEYPYRKIIFNDSICSICFSEGRLFVHHKDRNHFNNDIINLQIVCPKCHSKIHVEDRIRGFHGRIIA